MDPIIDAMKSDGVEITRENYIWYNWRNSRPDPWTVEEEGELPEDLQDWSLFEKRDGEYVYVGDDA